MIPISCTPYLNQQSPKTFYPCKSRFALTHWGRVTHICVGNLTIIGSDNGLSPDRRQAIIWTNAGILLIGPLGTNFSEILAEIITFSFKQMYLKVSSAKWCPFCLGLNVLMHFLGIRPQHICASGRVDFKHCVHGNFTGTRGNHMIVNEPTLKDMEK